MNKIFNKTSFMSVLAYILVESRQAKPNRHSL